MFCSATICTVRDRERSAETRIVGKPLVLAEQLIVALFRKTNKQGLALADGGGSEIPRGAEQVRQESGLVGSVLRHVQRDDLLSLGHQDALHRSGQCQCLGGSLAVLAGIGPICYLPVARVKKLLRLFASRSALAVIEPIDNPCHAGISSE